MDDSHFSAAVLTKLPLADAVWRLLQFAMSEPWLQDVWQRHRGRCYERVLKFETLVPLIAEALLQHGGSGRQSFERRQEDGTLPVAVTSAFEKLGNLPVAVSEALLEEGMPRLQAVRLGAAAVHRLPACWRGHELFAIDGKAVKHVKRLLKPLRNLRAGILGGRAAVALNLRTGLVSAMVGHLDGEAGENALSEKLLSKVAAAAGTQKPWVVVLDRLYGNLIFPRQVLQAGGHFLIRYNAHTRFVADTSKPAQEGRLATGARCRDEWGWLGQPKDPRSLRVRRVTLWLANGKTISVVTDLADSDGYPAEDLLETYRERWGLEKVFHQITDVFSLRKLIGTKPQAALFQLAFCLLLYNTLQVVRAYVAHHQGCEPETISNEKLFYDVKRQLVAANELIDSAELPAVLAAPLTASELQAYLARSLQGVWSKRWRKALRSRGGGHQKVKTRVPGNHTSTYRVLQAQHSIRKRKRP
jgi:Transposase DDE domain